MIDSHQELTEVFSLNAFGVCIKDANKNVLLQNDRCLEVCGNQTGLCCSKGCMELYANDNKQQWKNQGGRVYKNIRMNDEYYDIHLLCGKENLITFLVPLKNHQSKALEFYQDKGLTHREMEVISMVIYGHSNKYITEKLTISKATLKSHLTNIYRKIREQGAEPEYIPANRMMR